MKNKKHWFAGLAFALPVAVLLVVLSSMQPASADVGQALPHKFYGGVIYTDDSPVPAGRVIHAEGEGVELGNNNPITTTVEGEYGVGTFDPKLEVQGSYMERGTPITFYVAGKPATVRECDDTTGPWLDTWPWHEDGEGLATLLTCLNLKVAPDADYTLTVRSEGCCPITVTVGGEDGVLIPKGEERSFPEVGSADLQAIDDDICCDFVKWTVDGITEVVTNPIPINMADYGRDITVVGTCDDRGPFDLTVNQVGTGTIDPLPGTYSYDCCTWVTMTANDEGWWVFDHWGGDVDPALTTTNPISIHMNDPKVVTATFVERAHEYPLTVTSDGCYTIEVTYDITTEVVAPDTTEVFDIPTAASTVTLETVGDCCSLIDWELDGAPQGNDPILIVPVDGPHTVVAFSHGPPFTLTLDTAGRGGGTVEGAGVYTPCHTMATITATPDANSVFAGWSGDWVSADAVTDVDMNTDRMVIATFNLVTFTMTISEPVPPEGGTVDVDEEWPDPEGEYEYGETVTVTAVASPCYEFVEWGGDWAGITETQVVFTVTEELNIFAKFQKQMHTLTVIADPSGGGSVMPTSVYTECCTWITLTAEPSENWQFMGWSDKSGDLGSNKVITVHVDEEDLVVTATFALETFIVTFPHVEGGEVVPEPTQPPEGYECGQVVTLTAEPDDCYDFVEWTGLPGGVLTDTDTVTITVTAEMTITPIFERDVSLHNLNVYAEAGGTWALDPPGGVYTCCTWVTVIATPTTRYSFTGWIGDLVTTTNPISVHMLRDDIVITATFEMTGVVEVLLVGQVGAGNFVNFDGVSLTVRFNGAANETMVPVDASGLFTVTTDDITIAYPAVYTVCVKEMRALAVCQVGVDIPTIAPPVDFDAIVAGDGTDDNIIDTTDFSVWVTVFTGGGGYEKRADYNNDGVVDTTDFSAWVTNFTGGNTQGDPW